MRELSPELLLSFSEHNFLQLSLLIRSLSLPMLFRFWTITHDIPEPLLSQRNNNIIVVSSSATDKSSTVPWIHILVFIYHCNIYYVFESKVSESLQSEGWTGEENNYILKLFSSILEWALRAKNCRNSQMVHVSVRSVLLMFMHVEEDDKNNNNRLCVSISVGHGDLEWRI